MFCSIGGHSPFQNHWATDEEEGIQDGGGTVHFCQVSHSVQTGVAPFHSYLCPWGRFLQHPYSHRWRLDRGAVQCLWLWQAGVSRCLETTQVSTKHLSWRYTHREEKILINSSSFTSHYSISWNTKHRVYKKIGSFFCVPYCTQGGVYVYFYDSDVKYKALRSNISNAYSQILSNVEGRRLSYIYFSDKGILKL